MNADYSQLFRRDTLTMENLRVRDTKILGSYSSGTFRASAVERFATEQIRQMAIEFQVQVLARKLVSDRQELVVRYPATWWQHLKASHAPGWVKKRWPVRWTTHEAAVNFTRYDTYPMADVPLPPEFGKPYMADTIVWERLPEAGPDEPVTVFTTSGDFVSPGRQFLSRKDLTAELSTLLDFWYGRQTAGAYPEPPKLNPRVAAQGFLDILSSAGLNLDGLVQRQQIDQARREIF